jgi:hypothetical protein
VSESSQSSFSGADTAAPESRFASEVSFVDAAPTGYSPPGPGSQGTYLRIANLRI